MTMHFELQFTSWISTDARLTGELREGMLKLWKLYWRSTDFSPAKFTLCSLPRIIDDFTRNESTCKTELEHYRVCVTRERRMQMFQIDISSCQSVSEYLSDTKVHIYLIQKKLVLTARVYRFWVNRNFKEHFCISLQLILIAQKDSCLVIDTPINVQFCSL